MLCVCAYLHTHTFSQTKKWGWSSTLGTSFTGSSVDSQACDKKTGPLSQSPLSHVSPLGMLKTLAPTFFRKIRKENKKKKNASKIVIIHFTSQLTVLFWFTCSLGLDFGVRIFRVQWLNLASCYPQGLCIHIGQECSISYGERRLFNLSNLMGWIEIPLTRVKGKIPL